MVISPSPASPAIAARATSCGLRTNKPISWGAIPVAEPSLDRLANGVGFRRDAGEGYHLRCWAVEHRDDPATLVLQAVGVAQHRRQQLVGGAADRLRGAVADLERVRPPPHVDTEARPRERMLENALPDVAGEEQATAFAGATAAKNLSSAGARSCASSMTMWSNGLLSRFASTSARPVKTSAQVV